MLGARLNTCLSYIKNKHALVDVGTDHAKLVVEAVTTGKVKKAYAIDNKKGPLTSALSTIKSYELDHKIKTILSDGITDLPEDADVLVIAGLGGNTIYEILNNKNTKNLDTFIVQPNVTADKVRHLTKTNSLKIIDETLVLEDGIIYPIIVLTKGTQTLDEKDIVFGPVLRQKKGDLFISMLEDEQKHLERIITSLPTHVDKAPLIKRLTLIKEVLHESS